LGLTASGASTTKNFPVAVMTVLDEIRRFIYPQDVIIVIFVLVPVIYFICREIIKTKQRNVGIILCAVWVIVALFGFLVHAAPGSAYFPLLFVPFSLLIGYGWGRAKRFWIPLLIFFLVLVISNGLYTVRNQYFLDSRGLHGSAAPGWNYGLGETLGEQIDVSEFIVRKAEGRQINLYGGGFLTKFATSVDNFRYLVWYLGREVPRKPGSVSFRLYKSFSEIPRNTPILYTNSFVYVTKK
jgi:hypothetical protein